MKEELEELKTQNEYLSKLILCTHLMVLDMCLNNAQIERLNYILLNRRTIFDPDDKERRKEFIRMVKKEVRGALKRVIKCNLELEGEPTSRLFIANEIAKKIKGNPNKVLINETIETFYEQIVDAKDKLDNLLKNDLFLNYGPK